MVKFWRVWRAKNETDTTTARPASGRPAGWQCALLASFVLAAFVGLNLAGCGGGGSGGGIFQPTTVSVTIQLQDSNGAAQEGTVTLNSQTLTTSGGQAVFSGLKPGTYQLTYDVPNDAFPSQSANIVVGNDAAQTFVAVPGVTGVVGSGGGMAGITVSGRIFLNTGDPSAFNCRLGSLGVCATVLVRVRDLNQAGTPIVASQIKPDQCNLSADQRGLFVVQNVPGPGTYRIEVRQAPPAPNAPPDTTAPFTGNSASFTVIANQSVSDLNICANASAVAPGTPPPPPITPTPAGTLTFPTATPIFTLSGTPPISGIPTPTPTSNATPTATPTVTATADATATAVANVTATASADATAAATVFATNTPTPSGITTLSKRRKHR